MGEYKDGMLSNVDFNNIIEISIDSLKKSVYTAETYKKSI